MRKQGHGRLVFGCALMRARAGTAHLPYFMHLLEVTFRAWRLSSVQRLTCCLVWGEVLRRRGECDCRDVILGAGQACVRVFTDARACRGVSPVAMASSQGHPDCVAALVRAGAPPP